MASSSSPSESVGLNRHWRSGRRGAWPLVGLVIVLIAWHVGSLQRDVLLDRLEAQGRQEIDLYLSHLSGQLDRYAFLPELLADDFRLQSLLLSPANSAQQERVNRFLGHVNASAGALDVYLMDALGETLAASNWQHERTFIGQNFAFRPYFIEAMQGSPGRYFALGTTSGRRGYYFSYPVGDLEDPMGVVVVKIGIDTFEKDWRAEGSELVVSDPDGVIFVSTRPNWRFRTLRPLSNEQIDAIRATRRYPDAGLTAVFAESTGRRPSGAEVLRAADGGVAYLSILRDMPEAGWQVRLLVSRGLIAPQVWQARLLALSLLLLAATVVGLLLARWRRRREREAERRQVMQDALRELEARVDQRTLDLTEANRLLRQEIDEHERTRDELIQAAKLAALGQMSAGINHELNQPLAAMRTYAENARTFLDRGNLEQAAWNLAQISELTRRMAQISGQLKVFSRRASGQRLRVSLRACIDGARRIVGTRLAQCGAELTVELPGDDLFVAADMVQLEQVLVNLIGNACDALVDQPRRQISLSAWRDGAVVRLRVQDSGPGIENAQLQRIFDPFFTTTESGLGLGLSISHTIAQRLGGSLTAGNAADGGAVFTLTLDAWDESPAAMRAGER
jgi:two-component system C4-dicarboxylate transport sensor histidine kinase DctB